MIFRLSQKLAAKIKVGGMLPSPLAENPFVDWSAHVFVVDRTQYVLLTNTRSLYSVVMVGKGVADENRFLQRSLESIREFMTADGLGFLYSRFIASETGKVAFSKALDRRVSGSMNDLVFHAGVWLTEGNMSPHETGFKLNEMPMTLLAKNKSETHGIPREVFSEMKEGA
ncbi:hypothetical protein QQ056_11135 [Oscillatoria laete-virens NRMC-F 0139]|nr:hypothetical protein [Oscillatoria laete-virens]MDL5054094.1 hypothetical protein [Oscillatoria laete-virens NRMC-F 0139]